MRLNKLLQGSLQNHIYPFMWVHGETETVYRETVRAIHGANIGGFCVEARPHPDFCKENWWRDMEIILDEAEKLGMRVWILDDKHFPTGYAAGAAEHAPAHLRRQSVLCREISVEGPVELELSSLCVQESNLKRTVTDQVGDNLKPENTFDDDRFLGAAAISLGGSFLGAAGAEPLDLGAYIENGVLRWTPPEGQWKIALCWLSRNAGVHRSYINMADKESCRILLDAVYEPHYAHFGDKFGTVIAGFFSDEPELGNGYIYDMYNTLGTPQDLPWSRELETALREQLGDKFTALLPLLWNNDCPKDMTARVRYIYMDCLTRLVERNFSVQIGDWCRAHGVEYIGHVIEDLNQHARTGTSLGHFFRGLKGQSMSGIDVIGGQIYPQGENTPHSVMWGKKPDPEFYHYALCKLGSSFGELNPNMQDRTMCELFGNYQWMEGVQLEKYLADHCMVRGINRFVPHAFSCMEYPDPDCPPHFHAHGNDPLYRHFGRLMLYMNRVTNLLSGGVTQTPAAILYHGEAEWAGEAMMMQKPAHILQDHQIDFHFVPGDVFTEPDFYRTEIGETLTVNGKSHRIMIVPYAEFLPKAVLEGLAALSDSGCPVLFLQGLPTAAAEGGAIPEALRRCRVVDLLELQDALAEMDLSAVRLQPGCNRIRALYSKGEEEVVYLFNEAAACYAGTVQLPWQGDVCLYNAWENRLEYAECTKDGVKVKIRPSESCILVRCRAEDAPVPLTALCAETAEELTDFRISCCRSIEYPDFKEMGTLTLPEPFSSCAPDFSGFIAYETAFRAETGRILLEIEDAHEGVEIFVNGQSAGLQILPPYRFEITDLCVPGENRLRIEVATTLERENHERQSPFGAPIPLEQMAPTGITGKVKLLTLK